MHKSLPRVSEDYELGTLITRRIWVACNDVNEDNCTLAKKLWDIVKPKVMPTVLCGDLLGDVVHPVDVIQEAGAKALAALIKSNPDLEVVLVLNQLKEIYMEKLVVCTFLFLLHLHYFIMNKIYFCFRR